MRSFISHQLLYRLFAIIICYKQQKGRSFYQAPPRFFKPTSNNLKVLNGLSH